MTMTKILAIHTIVLPCYTAVLHVTKHLTKPHLVLCKSITIDINEKEGNVK